MRPARSLALVTAGVGLLLTGACGSGDSDHTASVGEVVRAGSDTTIDGSAVRVTIPTGTVGLKVGKPVSSVAADDTFKRTKLTAPDGGSLVPVGWTLDGLGSTPWGGVLARPAKPATVSLVDGDHTYRIGSPYSTNGSALATSSTTGFYVALGDRPSLDDLKVKVEYDGGAEVVSAATGEPADGSPSLADLSPTRPAGRSCPTSGWRSDDPALDIRVDCTIDMIGRTAYFPGVGWAPEGTTLQVVDVPEVRLLDAVDNSGSGSTTYKVTGIVDHSTLGSARSATALHALPPPQEYVAGGTLVFRTDPGATDPVKLSLTFELRADDVRGDSHAPDQRKVTISRRIPLH